MRYLFLALMLTSFTQGKSEQIIKQNATINNFNFYVVCQKVELGYKLLAIQIKDRKTNSITQVISENIKINIAAIDGLFIKTGDLNFDGNIDFYFPLEQSVNGTIFNSIYLYNSSTKQFQRNIALETAVGVNLIIDSKNHLLNTSVIGGCCNSKTSEYGFINNNLVLVSRAEYKSSEYGGKNITEGFKEWYENKEGNSQCIRRKEIGFKEVHNKVFSTEKFYDTKGSNRLSLLREVDYEPHELPYIMIKEKEGQLVQIVYNYNINKLTNIKATDSLFYYYPERINIAYQPEIGELNIPEGLKYTITPEPGNEVNMLVDGGGQVINISTEEKNKWKFPYDLKVGMSLIELQKINGKVFKISGFETDYGGSVNWNGGNLAKKNISVEIGYKASIPEEFIGDKAVIISDNPKLNSLKLFVRTITVNIATQ